MIDLFSELFGMFDDFDSVFAVNSFPKETKKCPVCQSSWEDFRKTGRFGCGECYKTFESGADEVLKQIHSSTANNGKIPSKSGAQVKAKRRLIELKAELKTAVANEDYERAAKLHSEIKEIEAGGIK